MTRAASPFSPRAVLAMLAVGAGAFLLLLYAIGAGWDGSEERSGGAHAAAKGLNGFAGLVRLLEEGGHDVSLSRSETRLDGEGLLVLTPQHDADGARIAGIIDSRRYIGPTLLILPKWFAMPADAVGADDVPSGWVVLAGGVAPDWLQPIAALTGAKAKLGKGKEWHGMGRSGRLPDATEVLGLDGAQLIDLVIADDGRTLAGYWDDGGHYPVLAANAGVAPRDSESETWPVVVVAEPDLLNNYGLADRERAALAHSIVDAAIEDYELEVVFDLTVAGLGQSENLLTLAFRPPFLAATLCLLLAALVIAWRGLQRFGPPVAEVPVLAMGKRQLARNGAALVERARRVHLLGPPYAAIVAARMAALLGIREADPAARDAAIASALAARGLATDYAERAAALARARHSAELLRAAGALRTIERTLTP